MAEKFVNINDRSEFVDALADLLTSCHAKHKSGCFAPDCRECIDRFFGISNGHLLPTTDVAPVRLRHGRWYNRGGRFRCSVCDNKALLKDIGGTGGWSHEYEQQKSPYCPNCGAKMDEQ